MYTSRRTKVITLSIVLIASLMALAGCEPANGERAERQAALEPVRVSISAVGNQMLFDTDELRIPANSQVTLVLVNPADSPAMAHNWVLVEHNRTEEVGIAGGMAGLEREYIPDHHAVLAHTALAQPGETVEVTFEAPPAGTYSYVCTVPGHYASMRGTLIVE
ncbi:MAG: auracyanin [Bradymonadaceae bacterium]|nr:auracyanin [Lujinxingiaceae bacterium]